MDIALFSFNNTPELSTFRRRRSGNARVCRRRAKPGRREAEALLNFYGRELARSVEETSTVIDSLCPPPPLDWRASEALSLVSVMPMTAKMAHYFARLCHVTEQQSNYFRCSVSWQ